MKCNTMRHNLRVFIRWMPLLGIVLIIFTAWHFKLLEYFSYAELKEHHVTLKAYVSENYLLASIIYLFSYIAITACSIPLATILSLAGGFLFGIVIGSIMTVVAATCGACLFFLAVKLSVGHWIADKSNRWIARMSKGFKENAFNYLLFLRILPIFPFWAINVTAALLNMRLSLFFLATLIGIVPGTIVYVSLGNSLNVLFSSNKQPELSIIFKPEVLFPLIFLAILSLTPVLYKQFKKKDPHATH